MTRHTFALVAAVVCSLVPLGACGALSGGTAEHTPSATGRAPTVAGTAATNPTMSMEEHSPIPANTSPVSVAEIYQMSRKGVLLVQGKHPDGSYAWGSAFIHDLDEQVAITNAHVVDGIEDLQAVFFDGTQQDVVVLGSDPCTDLAVIRVAGLPKGSVRLPLGDSDKLAPGDEVTAIGYPANGQYGGAQAVPSTGVVQDLGVKVNIDPALPDYVDAIQHGATLQPGNSGGPLLDNLGNVVGVNTMSDATDQQGQYFAIPIKTAHPESETLMAGGNLNTLGWTLTPHSAKRPLAGVESELREQGYGGGLFVESTEPGSPVDGRVKVGDLVWKLDDKRVNTQQDVCDVVSSTSPGRLMTVDGVHVLSRPALERFHAQWRVPGGH